MLLVTKVICKLQIFQLQLLLKNPLDSYFVVAKSVIKDPEQLDKQQRQADHATLLSSSPCSCWIAYSTLSGETHLKGLDHSEKIFVSIYRNALGSFKVSAGPLNSRPS